MAGDEATSGWTTFYQAQNMRAPRPLFLDTLARFEAEGVHGAGHHAVDLGCGSGTETLALLERGWHVLAVDREPEAIALLHAKLAPSHAARLETRIAGFDDINLPAVDLIWAGFSLPFCAPEQFDALWARIVASIIRGGRFAGQFFGERDSWAGDPTMTFHSAERVRRLLEPLETEVFNEVDEDGMAVSGPKHWHVFNVIARKVRA